MNRLLPSTEQNIRIRKIQSLMAGCKLDAVLISTNANIYYTAGLVFAGYVYIPAEGDAVLFVRRPIGLADSRVVYIKKPEQIAEALQAKSIHVPDKIGFELDRISYSDAQRLAKAFGTEEPQNCSPLMSTARSVKTECELELIRQSGVRHCMSYQRIPGLYRKGMTDCELQIELERVLRLDGCLGLFRIAGESMEQFMGNVLTGDNADTPSPYDFAMGGEGLDSSIPTGCNGSIIRPGTTVMIDMNGNFTGYMTDMTRTFYAGSLNETAKKAHQLSIDIHKALIPFIKPGAAAKEAYELSMGMVKAAGMEAFYMGHTQQAGFIGHGIGIEVNEWPVIAPRSKHLFEKGNVIAIEPKFVIPGVGAAGIENTYSVTENGLECLTVLPEELIQL